MEAWGCYYLRQRRAKWSRSRRVKDSGLKRTHTKQPFQRQQAGSTALDSANGLELDYNQIRHGFFIGSKETPLPNQWWL
jgi:hypothetical protein